MNCRHRGLGRVDALRVRHRRARAAGNCATLAGRIDALPDFLVTIGVRLAVLFDSAIAESRDHPAKAVLELKSGPAY